MFYVRKFAYFGGSGQGLRAQEAEATLILAGLQPEHESPVVKVES